MEAGQSPFLRRPAQREAPGTSGSISLGGAARAAAEQQKAAAVAKLNAQTRELNLDSSSSGESSDGSDSGSSSGSSSGDSGGSSLGRHDEAASPPEQQYATPAGAGSSGQGSVLNSPGTSDSQLLGKLQDRRRELSLLEARCVARGLAPQPSAEQRQESGSQQDEAPSPQQEQQSGPAAAVAAAPAALAVRPTINMSSWEPGSGIPEGAADKTGTERMRALCRVVDARDPTAGPSLLLLAGDHSQAVVVDAAVMLEMIRAEGLLACLKARNPQLPTPEDNKFVLPADAVEKAFVAADEAWTTAKSEVLRIVIAALAEGLEDAKNRAHMLLSRDRLKQCFFPMMRSAIWVHEESRRLLQQLVHASAVCVCGTEDSTGAAFGLAGRFSRTTNRLPVVALRYASLRLAAVRRRLRNFIAHFLERDALEATLEYEMLCRLAEAVVPGSRVQLEAQDHITIKVADVEVHGVRADGGHVVMRRPLYKQLTRPSPAALEAVRTRTGSQPSSRNRSVPADATSVELKWGEAALVPGAPSWQQGAADPTPQNRQGQVAWLDKVN